METSESPLAPAVETLPEPIVRPTRKPKDETKAERQPPYAVILHNDDLNGMDFVIDALRKVFNYDLQKAMTLMMQAHETGRSIVWTGSLEVAELKRDQLQSCGADPVAKQRGAQPLSVSVEQLPS